MGIAFAPWSKKKKNRSGIILSWSLSVLATITFELEEKTRMKVGRYSGGISGSED
jgi:hypothetical protein